MPDHLYIIRTVENLKDNNSTLYTKAIIRECVIQCVNYSVECVNTQEDLNYICSLGVPYIVMLPCEFEIPKSIFNLETNITSEVVKNCCDSLSNHFSCKKPSVLIINRSDLIGLPLFNLLIKDDYTVSVAHSKTDIDCLKKLVDVSDIIVLATGHDMSHLDLHSKYVIDVSGDYKLDCLLYIGMGQVGKNTVKKLIEKAKSLLK